MLTSWAPAHLFIPFLHLFPLCLLRSAVFLVFKSAMLTLGTFVLPVPSLLPPPLSSSLSVQTDHPFPSSSFLHSAYLYLKSQS